MDQAKLKRPRTVHFPTRNVGKITEYNIVESLMIIVDKDDIQAVQITTEEARITLKNEEAKQRVKNIGFNLNGQHISVQDADKVVTNVTVKDAPIEMSAFVIATYLQKFGQLVPGSGKRGKIKNSEIENGTRYFQLMLVEKVIPVEGTIGSFQIRVFCDNNKTACKFCHETDHPYFKCPKKGENTARKCFRCLSTEHTIANCTNQIKCRKCMEEGHKERDCKREKSGVEKNTEMKAQIINSEQTVTENMITHNTLSDDDSESDHEKLDPEIIDLDQNELAPSQPCTAEENRKSAVVIGDSIIHGMSFENKEVVTVAKSGARISDIDQLLKETEKEVLPENTPWYK